MLLHLHNGLVSAVSEGGVGEIIQSWNEPYPMVKTKKEKNPKTNLI